ncbi:MAG: energy transducer TonB, partial [Alcaligenaceae bacterium]|nr:energy transducer TonB [Alcaligenaceae bacterium]
PAPAKPAPAAAGPSGQETAPVAKAPSAPVDPDRPRVIGKVDYVGKRPSPVYPRMSQRRGEQGRVIVRVLISPEGRVLNATVQRSSGHDRLDAEAIKAVRSARFKPYTENGHAYRAMADIPFDFVL